MKRLPQVVGMQAQEMRVQMPGIIGGERRYWPVGRGRRTAFAASGRVSIMGHRSDLCIALLQRK
jgi:hypothetical protein